MILLIFQVVIFQIHIKLVISYMCLCSLEIRKPLIFSETHINVKMWCVLMYNNFLLNIFICSCCLKNKTLTVRYWWILLQLYQQSTVKMHQFQWNWRQALIEVRHTGMPHTYFGPSAWASKKTSNVTLTYVLVLILPKFPYLGLTCTTPFQSLRVLAKSSWRESSASSDSVKCFKFLFTIQMGESFHMIGQF